MGETFLVTGAAGFIGSHVCQALLARGDAVLGLDNLNDYYPPARKRQNLEEVRASPGGSRFSFVEGDIRDRACIRRLFSGQTLTGVVHLAAMAGVRASIEDPELYYSVNLDGTLCLLNAARDHRTRSFVFASTSSAYGNSSRLPFTEDQPCDRPLAPYPASKRAAEMLGFTYHHLYQQNFTALRFFTVYGPRGRPDMMAYKVLDNLFFGREVPLFSGGNMHRDWTYVGDIAAGVLSAIDRPMGFEVINLGRGEPTLLSDFVALVESFAGKKGNLVPAPMQEADVAFTYADISKAQRLLDYRPTVSVKEGVGAFWSWYQAAVLGLPRR